MNIVVSIDVHYAAPLFALLRSLGQHPSRGELHVHVLTRDVPDSSRVRIERGAARANIRISCIEADSSIVQGLPTQRWITRSAYLKLLACELLPDEMDRMIILDADVIAQADVKALWDLDMEGKPLWAVQDYGCPYVSCSFGIKHYRRLGMSADEPYFNSGVMLVDPEIWRREKITEKCLAYLNAYRDDLRCHDQEALNAILVGRWGHLDPRWNQMPHIYRLDDLPPSPFREDLRRRRQEIVDAPYIVHFAARGKPWLPGCTHPNRAAFLHHLRASGWLTLPRYLEWRWRIVHRSGRVSPAPDADRPTTPVRYRAFATGVMSAGMRHRWVHGARSGVSRVMPTGVAKVLLSCDVFRTLDEHAERICDTNARARLQQAALGESPRPLGGLTARIARSMQQSGVVPPIAHGELEACRRQLEDFVRDGFLIADQDLRAQTALITGSDPDIERSGSRTRISMIGVPTRDRPELLRRALVSYATNIASNGRTAGFRIIDDSRNAAFQQENVRLAADIERRFGMAIEMVGAQQRTEFARQLIAESGASPDVIHFALFGDTSCDARFGAARNTLQLLSVGAPLIQVDDDTICRTARPREGMFDTPDDWRASGTQYWYLDSGAPLEDEIEFIDNDFVGSHEEMLGASLLALLNSRPECILSGDAGEPGPKRIQHGAHPEAGVAVTLGGAVGDSGLRDSWSRLFFQGPSFDRLVASEADYRRRLATREIARIAAAPVVSDTPLCVAMNLGLDNRRMLPPFMPVQRNEDGIFMMVMRRCMPFAFCAHLSQAIVHEPSARDSRENLDFGQVGRRFHVNDCLNWLLLFDGYVPESEDSARNLAVLGNRLSDIALLSPVGFQEHLRMRAASAVGNQIGWLERLLDQRGRRPHYWARDAERYIGALRFALTMPDFIVPSDLEGTPEERLATLQSLVGKYGQLLIHWPVIWEAAKRLKEREVGFASPTPHEMVVH